MAKISGSQFREPLFLKKIYSIFVLNRVELKVILLIIKKNMKKATLLMVFIITMLTLTACSSKQAANQQNPDQAGPNGRGNRMPDFGQPDKQADISGLVKSITGNQVTIIKMDRSSRGQATSTEANGANGQTNNQNRSGNNLSRTISGSTGGPGGMMGGGGQRPDGQGTQSAESRTAMLEQIKKMSTGEVTVTIPVGIKMLKSDTTTSGQQPGMIEATLADVTTDKMINVWTDESTTNGSSTDKKVASFVLIMK
jgi:hypothetical protein